MFDSLSDRLGGILDKLKRRGALTEADVGEAMREVRRALIEADVALDVVKSFTDKVRERAIGVEVVKSVTPGQMVVKIVNDELVAMLGSDADPIDLNAPAPVPILMVGLQGSGKTTSTAKIAKRLTEKGKRRVLMASLDTRRPAAMEQLATLGSQVGVATLPIVAGQSAVQIARRAMEAGRFGNYDVVMLDTAGRVTLDEGLMAEVAEVKAATGPHEVLLVADALTGQDAVNTAKAFDARVGLTGIILTRADGDGRGGAALSMRAVTGKPIKLIGTGEKMDALEDFDPKRVAGRILGMGDVVALVEKAVENIDVEKAKAVAEKMRKGAFDLEDLRDQLGQMQKLGGMSGLMGMLPGVAKVKNQIAAANIDDKVFRRQVAIINSMTRQERRNPKVLDASRKRRVAAGSGTKVEEINRLLKMHRQMADMMKAMGGAAGKRGPMAGLANMFGLGGGGAPSPEMLQQMAEKMPGGGGALPPTMPGLKGLPPTFPGGLPGLPRGLPGLGGPKKK
ncbi:signal recognition particle protein [Aquabacter sp. L1I39]|uniref:signal recognition particle protein n=1 Tax=Aquabacter sp. L1I39 TaxID=2820278 RepID=UPI001ADB116B|nr:signal recognition particle protein [Aquabacter sp. L1I39]QTL03525.1 signal recognition particle protein [Aquabacter sp. L1I39]